MLSEGPHAKTALWNTGQKNDTFKQFEELGEASAWMRSRARSQRVYASEGPGLQPVSWLHWSALVMIAQMSGALCAVYAALSFSYF